MIVVVADASPLIALERIDQLGLLKALFGEVLVERVLRKVGEDWTYRRS